MRILWGDSAFKDKITRDHEKEKEWDILLFFFILGMNERYNIENNIYMYTYIICINYYEYDL